ncbi:Uncharacterized protein dnm_061740 [Desulfonema magnum]|uniref:Uncharacterized protein n=1 Tax=Desulfonema magnum TaxID=45655 RepID=A0A975BR85_9BACT|nr:Uncharacterized protein dnm_061740 [Desulfonema magnum]
MNISSYNALNQFCKYQQVEKFPECVRKCKETRLFSRTGGLSGPKKPGFSQL